METEKLLFRLLEAFPVKVLKQHFSLNEVKREKLIIKIMTSFSEAEIISFCFQNFGFLKQHIYVVSPNHKLQSNWTPVPKYFVSNAQIEGQKAYNLLFTATYDVFNSSKNQKEQIHFYVPTQIRSYEGYLIISINILERSISNYNGDTLVLLTKRLDESMYIDQINESLPKGISVVSSDLNKGIKALWHEDYVDAAYVKFKKSKSTSTEAMDEANTLKVIYPDVYQKIMASPIDKKVLKVLDKTSVVKRFAIEPFKGKISISRFSDTNNAIVELVNLILSKN
ncbi:hypothetical protein [Aquimarina algicola]|uniref:Uncharacterized protein n=1 Tax=Aquimarina algicola TaxID=2589995 RepID=A0A504J0V9_9FLAO|nr:hypothetical protein [Aquimarina algicola]TPN84054.1 hypothetical protein FHK87_19020 [Aquimarina algicola]